MKEEVAKAQGPEPQPSLTTPTTTPIGGEPTGGSTGHRPETPTTPGTKGIGGIAPPPVAPPPPAKKTTFTASLKLDPIRAGLQLGDFLDEVMSHLQALPGAEVNLSVEVHVKAPNGIDDQTARMVLENSRSLKVDNPQIY